MQNISDKIGDNQYANISAVCMDCRNIFLLRIRRISPDKIEILNGAIGVHRSEDSNEYHFKCSNCCDNEDWGTPCEVYSRVVGYLRPVGSWNGAKQDEFEMRKVFQAGED